MTPASTRKNGRSVIPFPAMPQRVPNTVWEPFKPSWARLVRKSAVRAIVSMARQRPARSWANLVRT
jgi:hypothetical protein